MKKLFTEINQMKIIDKNFTDYIEIIFHDLFSDINLSTIGKNISFLELKNIPYKITLLITKNKEELNTIISTYPFIKIILPSETLSPIESLDLIIKESKSDFAFIIPVEYYFLEFDTNKLIQIFNKQKIFSIVPYITDIRNNPLAIKYGLEKYQNNIFITKNDFKNNKLTIFPYKFTAIIDVKIYNILTGLSEIYKKKEYSVFDFYYLSYLNDHQTILTNAIVLKESNKLNDGFNIKFHKKDFDFFLFKIKYGFKKMNFIKILFYFLTFLLKFNFNKIKLLVKTFQIKNDIKSKEINSFDDIILKFKKED